MGQGSGLWAVALVWALPITARADSTEERVAGPVSEEVQAFRDAQGRFSERMQELEDDTRRFVDLREIEEKALVDDLFDDRIANLALQEADQRETAIARMEDFVGRYPDLSYASHVRFRLAELWFEKSSEAWLLDSEVYNDKVNDPNTPIEVLEALGPEPRRDLARSLALYQRIIDDNRDRAPEDRYERVDGTYLMMGFVYNDPNSLQFDEARAKATFEELIRVLPDSELADRAHLFLGNFLFAANEFDAALAEYTLVYKKGTAGKYFEEAMYQLAWARYKLDAYDEALRLFTELLDGSEKTRLESGKESPFAPDARRFMAFSFADIAYDGEKTAVAVSKGYFAKNGERAYEREVYRQLADVLVRYTRPREAIETYELLQNDVRWVLEPDNPSHQIALVDLYLTSVARDLAAAGAARLTFIERYSEGSRWWDANRSNPEALEVARLYIESSLLDVAIEYRVRAQESGAQKDYALAADKYQEYLRKFPISDDYYKQQWYLADSLKLAGEFDRARAEFESLVRSRRHHPYGDAAMYSLMDVRLQRMLALGHAPDQRPTDGVVERSYQVGDKTIQVLALTEDRGQFIGSADMVLAHPFGANTDPELPDYQKAVTERGGSVLYLTGQILYYHSRYDEARKRFEMLIDRYPQTIEANYAAGLLVDSYLAEGNLAQVRAYSKKFTLNPPGPPADVDPNRFKSTLEGTTFQLAMQTAETQPLSAADQFLAFRKEFPQSALGGDALYNAAFYNHQAGRAEDANRLYEQFIAEYPTDKRAKGLFFRIAANYEATFDLEKAITLYDKVLAHKDATPAEKADALYNRSFLLIGLGRHRDAAQGYERYEADYPSQEDRENIMFLAGEQWEKVSASEATAFYGRYKKKYPSANADHYIEAEYRLLELQRGQKASDAIIKRQNDAIVGAFDRFAASGKPIGPKGHEVAAQAAFPSLERQFSAYSGAKLTGNESKDAKLLNETKPKELKAFEEEVKTYVGKYQNFEYNSGALLLQARGALFLADLGLSIKCPKGMSQDDCWLYEDILQENVFPEYYAVEEVGIRRLNELVDGAKEKKRHSPYVDQAMAELNLRRPSDFPAVKREIEGSTDFTPPIDVAPRRLGGK